MAASRAGHLVGARADRFLDLIGGAVANPAGRVRVVATLRADFFDRPLQRHPFAGVYRTSVVALAPLTPDELERAITRPAADRGVEISAGLLARLIADAQAEPGALPLLNVTLHELWSRRTGDVIEIDAYEGLGGLTGALVGRAESLVESLGPTGAAELRRFFGRLVAIDLDLPPTRRRARLSDIYAGGIEPATVEAVAEARLVTVDRDPVSRDPVVIVSHEAVLGRWPRLVEWLHEDRQRLYEHGRLRDAAEAWERDERDPALLLRGTRLDRAVELADSGTALIETERALVDASVAEREHEIDAERRQAQRRRTLTALASVVALIAVVAGAIALVQARRADTAARQAEIRLLTQGAVAASDERPELGLQLAIAAVQLDGGVNAERTLLDLLGRPLFDTHVGTAVDNACTAMSPNPSQPAVLSFAVPDESGRSAVTRWALDSGPSLPAGRVAFDGVRCPAVSPGGDRVAVLDGPGSVVLADTDTGEVLASAELEFAVREARWALDGTTVAVLDDSSGGSLVLLDPNTLNLVKTIPLDLDFIAAVVVTSVDGVAVVSSDAAPPVVVDLASGSSLSLEDPGERVGSLALAPGQDLVLGRTEASVLAWSLDGGDLMWSGPHSGTGRALGPLAVNSAGSHFALTTEQGLEVFAADSGRPVADPIPVVGAAAVVGFSGDEELIVSGAGDRLLVFSLAGRFPTIHSGYDAALVAADGSIATYVEDPAGLRNVVVGPDGAETDLGFSPMTHRSLNADTAVGYDIFERIYVVWQHGARVVEADLSNRGPADPEAGRSIRVGHGRAVLILVEDSSGPPDHDTSHLFVLDALTGSLLFDRAEPGVHLAEPIDPERLLLADVDFSARLIDLDGSTVHEFGPFGHGIEAMTSAGNGDLLFGLGDGSIVRHGADGFAETLKYVGPPSAVMNILPFDGGFVSQHFDGDIVKWYDESTEPAGTLFVGSGFAGFSSLNEDGTAVMAPEPGRVVRVPLSIDAFVDEACARVGPVVDETTWSAVTGSPPGDALEVCSNLGG